MAVFWAILIIGLLIAGLFLNIFSLPGNWLMLIFLVVWTSINGQGAMSWSFVLGMGGIIALAEVSEFLVQMYGAKKFGSTGKGNLGGIIGAIVGAIAGAPILFGIGALIFGLIGAFVGCFIFEKINGRNTRESIRASWGAFWGKFFGMSLKIGMGIIVIILSVPKIWPSS